MLCVIAKLGDTAAETLAAVRNAAFPGGEGAKPLYGHITLAAYTGGDEAGFIRSCRSLLADVSRFEIAYETVEVLRETSIVVAAPKSSPQLALLHRRIAEKHADELDRWTKDEGWYPHTTLFYGPTADLEQICGRMRAAFRPFSAEVCRIEFSRVNEDGYEIVGRIELPAVAERPQAQQ